MEVGKTIRKIRLERDLTLEQVGKVVGVSKQTIQRYESGEIQAIPYEKMLLLGKALNCSPAEFFVSEVSQAKSAVVSSTDKKTNEIIQKYSQLSDANKIVVDTLIQSLIENNNQ